LKYLVWSFFLTVLFSTGSLNVQDKALHKAIRTPQPPTQQYFSHASWYGNQFFGRHTSDGKVYTPDAVFVAHRSLPFGTKLKITNLRNHRTVTVSVEDRGPFVDEDNRKLDLTYAAAQHLDMINAGVVPVSYFIITLTPPAKEFPGNDRRGK
jgi:rare lipoprotein A (peptidoglycan hydrolase)